MLSPAVYGDKHEDPQQGIKQSMRDLGPLSLKWDVCVKSFPLRAPGILQKRRQKVSKTRRDGADQGKKAL